MDSPTASIKELTLRAVVVGLVLSIVMGAANVYLGLKAGMTVSASIPAAVMAMLILRAVFRGGTILEANQVQTAASAGESLAAGIIFTMPALLLIGAWQQFDLVLTTVIAFTGGLLGVLFMIPMRRVFVVTASAELKFPEGLACASVLKAGEGAGSEARGVVLGAVIGAAFKALVSFFGVMKGILEGAVQVLGDRIFYFGGDMSPALVAVGFIVRLNIALLIFIGGAIAWIIGIPLLGAQLSGGDPLESARTLWSTQARYLGVGAMIVGGFASIVRVRFGLLQAVREISRYRAGADTTDDSSAGEDRDISSKAMVALSAMAMLLIGVVYYVLTGNMLISLATTVIMILMAFFFTAVASYIVGLVGNSNSPVSGMTITALLFTGGLLLLFGFSGMEGMVATLGVAAIVCCAACTSGDVCNDLKTGALVGASPFRQQIMQILGVAAASLVMAPVLQLLHNNTPGGIGGRELSAPQASLFKSLAEGLFGQGNLPWNMVGIGVAVGCVILAVDKVLERQEVSFRMHVMPVAVGMYLPLGLSTSILIGGLLAHMVCAGEKGAAADQRLHRGVLFASGMIAGESLTGIGIALLASLGIFRFALGLGDAETTVLTVVGAVAILASFYLFSQPKKG
ncbi:oligopeptide transporter, OPT family [Acidobacteria bacterium AH-259-D05]|nr:oligopeptide transporter, OPT family [Acidobacteria bacterium AH-259-D05]